MRRSAGVTACAVIVILGSAILLLIALLGLLGMAVRPVPDGQAHFIKAFIWIAFALEFGGAGLGIATGVGLLRLKEWARISLLVFSGLLLFMGNSGLLMIPFVQIPQTPDLPDSFTFYMRLFMAVCFGLLATLGVWWIVCFNRKSVRAQFLGTPVEGQPYSATSARPISITIIGWYMVVSAFCALSGLFIHIPMYVLGFMMKGWAASLFLLGCGILQLVTGVGLLKLKPWSRSLAIGHFSFFTVNSALMVVLPGSQARFEGVMRASQEAFGTTAQPATMPPIPLWFGFAFCLPLFAVVLWFLITQKKSFLPSNQLSVPLV
jgi:hypothetical protein